MKLLFLFDVLAPDLTFDFIFFRQHCNPTGEAMGRDGSEMVCVGARAVLQTIARVTVKHARANFQKCIIFGSSALHNGRPLPNFASSQSRAGAVFRIAKRSGS